MISVKNLKKTYLLGGEEVHALDDVSLSIKEHEFVAIIGQSGSGKSTFMNMLGCLDRPDSGEITLDGTDIAKRKSSQRLIWTYRCRRRNNPNLRKELQDYWSLRRRWIIPKRLQRFSDLYSIYNSTKDHAKQHDQQFLCVSSK